MKNGSNKDLKATEGAY